MLVISLVGCASYDRVQRTLSDEELGLVDYLFSSYTEMTPGLSYVVIQNGAIIDKNSFGLANVDARTLSNSDTNYRIASVAKQFTAMAIMILEHQGKLAYETTLTEIFPDFPEYGRNITVRHLLTHQSGLVDYYDFIPEERTKQILDVEILEHLTELDTTYFLPGSEYRYSNSGYAVLSQIVEKISGKSFAHFMNESIFQKLKMSNTEVFELNNPVQARAYGYSFDGDSIRFNDQSVTSAIQGDGGIYSNILDYYKWDQALYSDILLPRAKLEEAFYDWDDHERTDKEGYGYGWYVDFNDATKLLNHSGGTVGFESRVTRIPSLQLTVAMFSNHDGHDRNLLHRVNALISIYSNYEIPMSVEIMMKRAIDQQGIVYGIEKYDLIKDHPNYEQKVTSLSYLGFEYRRMQKLEEAEALFRKATQEYPNHFGGYYGLGRVYKDTDQVEKALTCFRKVVALGAENEQWIIDRTKKDIEELMNE